MCHCGRTCLTNSGLSVTSILYVTNMLSNSFKNATMDFFPGIEIVECFTRCLPLFKQKRETQALYLVYSYAYRSSKFVFEFLNKRAVNVLHLKLVGKIPTKASAYDNI